MKLSSVSMALILVLVTNVVRKAIFPGIAEREVVVPTLCSMLEVAIAKDKTLGLGEAAMMDKAAYMIRPLLLRSRLRLLVNRLSMSRFQPPEFTKAREVASAMWTSLSRCMILVHMMGRSLLLHLEDMVIVAEPEDVAVVSGVVVAVALVDIAMLEITKAMEETLPMRTSLLQSLSMSLPSRLKVIGLMLVIARLQLRPAGKHSSKIGLLYQGGVPFTSVLTVRGLTGFMEQNNGNGDHVDRVVM